MIADDNARRRNLVVMSLLIIFYNVSGARFLGEDGVMLGFINVRIEHPLAIYVFAWGMFAWAWWQFSINTEPYKKLLQSDLAQHAKGPSKAAYGQDHALYKRMRDEANVAFKGNPLWISITDGGDRPPAFLSVKSKTFLLVDPWIIAASATASVLEAKPETKISFHQKIRILWTHMVSRPGFSDNLIPYLFAILAILTAFVWTLPSIALLIFPPLLVYFPDIARKINII